MSVRTDVSDGDVARIPSRGPLVVVANHPFGLLEALVIERVLARVRPDVKILANSLLAVIPELQERLILVEPFESREAKRANTKPVRQVLEWLRDGHAMLCFPAGEVSHLDLRQRAITDPQWNDNIVRFARNTRSAVLPVFVTGGNSPLFQVMGMMDPRFRTARLLHEFTNKEHQRVSSRIGTVMPSEAFEQFESDRELTRYLRHRTYLLGSRKTSQHPALRMGIKRLRPIAATAPTARMAEEIAALPPDQCLTGNEEFSVYIAEAHQIPCILPEIGRLREIAFREEGEGTGQPRDLDRFDRDYQQLFVWSRQHARISGGYRLASSADLLERRGIGGLYTSSLFDFREDFFDRLGPALELGRSFVIPEYQKQYAPLLLLWKAIAMVVSRRPDHPILFEAVSISNDYQPVSRSLMVRYLATHQRSVELSCRVRPRRPFNPFRRSTDGEAISLMLRSVDDLSTVTADIEPDGKGIPILLKQYLRLGGKVLGFNVDSAFSNALDVLIMVDLRQTQPAILQRYLGRHAAADFLAWHDLRKNGADSVIHCS